MSADRVVSPPRDQLNLLRTPLTSAEEQVFQLFDTKLPPEWEIYIKSHLNGLRPGFVLLNPNAGIGVFDVIEWELGQTTLHVEWDAETPQLWKAPPIGEKVRIDPTPSQQSAV